jgi:hypothetical protein
MPICGLHNAYEYKYPPQRFKINVSENVLIDLGYVKTLADYNTAPTRQRPARWPSGSFEY